MMLIARPRLFLRVPSANLVPFAECGLRRLSREVCRSQRRALVSDASAPRPNFFKRIATAL